MFGDGLNMAWKAPIPQGKSSPVLTDRLIFLTAHEGEHLLVLAYDREMGKLLWRRSIEKRHNESRNSLNDAAASTPVTDGHNVFVFFSEAGLASYDSEGNKRWFVPLGPFDSEHGISTSPILVDEKVVLMIDQIGESYIVAFDSRDGRQAWKTEKLSVMGGYSTPASYEPSSGPAQIIGISPVELAGYSAQSGERLWWVHGLSYQSRASPAIGAGKAYATTSGFGGGPAWPFEKLAEWG